MSSHSQPLDNIREVEKVAAISLGEANTPVKVLGIQLSTDVQEREQPTEVRIQIDKRKTDSRLSLRDTKHEPLAYFSQDGYDPETECRLKGRESISIYLNPSVIIDCKANATDHPQGVDSSIDIVLSEGKRSYRQRWKFKLLPFVAEHDSVDIAIADPASKEPVTIPEADARHRFFRLCSVKIDVNFFGKTFALPYEAKLNIGAHASTSPSTRLETRILPANQDTPDGFSIDNPDHAVINIHHDVATASQAYDLYLFQGIEPGELDEPAIDTPVELHLAPTIRQGKQKRETRLPPILLGANRTPPSLKIAINGKSTKKPILFESATTHRSKLSELPEQDWRVDYGSPRGHKPVFLFDLHLHGHLGSTGEASFSVTASSQFEQDGDLLGDAVSFEIVCESNNVDYQGGNFALKPSARAVSLSLVGHLDFDKELDPARSYIIIVTVEILQKESGILRGIRQRLTLAPTLPERYLAIDLGTSSIAMAMAQGDRAVEILELGKIIKVVDPDHQESPEFIEKEEERQAEPFIASAIGLDPDDSWRHKNYALSLWGYSSPENTRLDAKSCDKVLQRHFAISLPFAPGSEFGNARGRTLAAPKMLLMNPSGTQQMEHPIWTTSDSLTNEVQVGDVISDVLHELTHLYLPWTNRLEQAQGSRLILTHPNSYGEEHQARLRAAASAACRQLATRLEDTLLVRESDAAAFYFLSEGDEIEVTEDKNVLVFDLGAGTADITLTRAEPANRGRGRAVIPKPIRQLGAAVGGDTIDFVLFFIIHALLGATNKGKHKVDYQHHLLKSTHDSKPANQANHLSAKRKLATAIRKGKGRLHRECYDHCQQASQPYCWPEDIHFHVQIGEHGDSADQWPVRKIGTAPLETPDIAGGASLYEKNGAIWLKLSKAAVNREAMQRLIEFMTRRIVELAFESAPDGMGPETMDKLLITGRASLWPLIHEGLRKTQQQHHPRMSLFHSLPPPPDELKMAVVQGAIDYGRSLARGQTSLSEDRFQNGVLVYKPGKRNTNILDWVPLEAGTREEKITAMHLIGLMKAPPGLTIRDLVKNPWGPSLLIRTSRGVPAAHLNPDANQQVTIKQITLADGRNIIQIGEADIDDVQGSPHPSPALHSVNYDVTQHDAPPNMGSVKPDPL